MHKKLGPTLVNQFNCIRIICVLLIFKSRFHNFVYHNILVSIVVSIPACHAGDRGSIPRRGDFYGFFLFFETTE